jgi:hypothetical protein
MSRKCTSKSKKIMHLVLNFCFFFFMGGFGEVLVR